MAYLSTKSNSNTTEKEIAPEQIKYEEQAYFELCQIINTAMQNKNLSAFESALSSWLNQYDLDSFVCKNYKEKIKALLITIESLKKILIEFQNNQPTFNLSKAYRKLFLIVENNKDINELKHKIEKWKEQYPPDKFNDYFKPKIKQITSDAHIRRIAFDQKSAFEELQAIISSSDTLYIEDLSEKVDTWKATYKIDDFISKYSGDVISWTDENYLISVSKPKDSIDDINDVSQEQAFYELVGLLKNPNNINDLFNWVYKYRKFNFNETSRNLISREFLKQYTLPSNSNFKIPDCVDLKSLSIEEFKTVDNLKKESIINFFGSLYEGNSNFNNADFEKLNSSNFSLSDQDINNLESIKSTDTTITQIKKVDKISNDVLLKNPRITQMSFTVVRNSKTQTPNTKVEIPVENFSDEIPFTINPSEEEIKDSLKSDVIPESILQNEAPIKKAKSGEFSNVSYNDFYAKEGSEESSHTSNEEILDEITDFEEIPNDSVKSAHTLDNEIPDENTDSEEISNDSVKSIHTLDNEIPDKNTDSEELSDSSDKNTYVENKLSDGTESIPSSSIVDEDKENFSNNYDFNSINEPILNGSKHINNNVISDTIISETETEIVRLIIEEPSENILEESKDAENDLSSPLLIE